MALPIIGNGGVIAEVDANSRALRATIRPIDVGALGAYSWAGITGTVAAGAGALSPWFSFRWGDATRSCLIRKVRVSLQSLTGFTAGNGLIDMIVARAFTASDTGGTASVPTGNSQKLRTGMGTTLVTDLRIATTAALGAGTRTLDGAPLADLAFSVNATANSVQLPTADIYLPMDDGWPLVLVQNEGFILRATVPATGTWNARARVYWEEVAAFP